MVELAAEPLYVLSQVQLRFKLRVGVDAAANIAKASLTLLLLRFQVASEMMAICFAQVLDSGVPTPCTQFPKFHMPCCCQLKQLLPLTHVHANGAALPVL